MQVNYLLLFQSFVLWVSPRPGTEQTLKEYLLNPGAARRVVGSLVTDPYLCACVRVTLRLAVTVCVGF